MIRTEILDKYLIHTPITDDHMIRIGKYAPISPRDQGFLNLISVLNVLLPLVFFGGSILSAVTIFYRSRLKQPIELLMAGADKISAHDLDFRINYEPNDEMGRLCDSFERMRTELDAGNRKMWRMMEERKRLNAAFAHDLRTPLTVLKGYTDFLIRYVPSGKISPEKLLATVSFMSDYVQRLEMYVDTMTTIQNLEDTFVTPSKRSTDDLIRQLKSSMEILSERYGKSSGLNSTITAPVLYTDDTIVFRVVENMLANAFRYAANQVTAYCRVQHQALVIEVTDDGPGFSPEALQLAAEPFYRGSGRADGSHHLGLGLHICRILCEKHGGLLRVENRPEGGANVTASFFLEVDKK
ncbi:HAMP domain-containing sensor histidine kinase [Paenibacillus sp. FJAT-26967]|uniref:HAMP domain-containing sensor histidine kinase n=1 Tax=Paenibacillus sp. FJAT-26967 TaxID=1729690 RepID=UPI0015609CE2|nr:HAMP domain-containing sensor histidine kinase [Paenibacillus sp. FJAT-26967]